MPTTDPRYNNAGIAYSVNNLMKAFAPPSDQDLASQSASRYNDARAEGQIVQNRATQSLADSVAQLMNVNTQPAPAVPAAATPMGAADGSMGEMPAVAPQPVDRNAALSSLASNYLQAGQSPGALGDVFRALLVNNTNSGSDTVNRAFVGAGGKLGENDSLDIGRQDQIRAQNQQNTIQKELVTPRVVSPGQGLASAMGYYSEPDTEEYRAARDDSASKPVVLEPKDLEGINSYLDTRFGIARDPKSGALYEDSGPDLSPATRQIILNHATTLMRNNRLDFQQASEQAIQDITGGKPLASSGEPADNGIPFVPFTGNGGVDTRQRSLTPEQLAGAGGPQAAAPQANQGASVTKTIGGVTYIKKDGQWYQQ